MYPNIVPLPKIKIMSFMQAESAAQYLAYIQFYGKGNPMGISDSFDKDQKLGDPWSEEEKDIAAHNANECVRELMRINLTKFIMDGSVPECVMSRRYMATGIGYTASRTITINFVKHEP